LTRETSKGFECNEFAAMIGEPNLAWQDWLNIHALELLEDGTPRFRVVIVLVARQNGKSTSKRKVSLWRMFMDGARVVLGTAQDVALAREQMNLCKAAIMASPDLAAEWGGQRNVNGDEMFWLLPDGMPANTPREALPRYVVRATNRKAGRGLAIDELNIDELREQRDWKAWAAVSKTVMARPNSQIWVMSNAGDDESVVLNQLCSAAGMAIGSDGISVLGPARDQSIGLFAWVAPEGCDLDDWDAIAQANPALNSGGPTTAAIRTALGTDPPEIYRTEVLCQKVDALDSAVDLSAWAACADPQGSLDGLRDRVAACFDISADGQHATLAAAARTADGRVRVEIVEAWNGSDTARAELEDFLDRVKPQVIAWYPGGPGAAFASILRPADLEVDAKLPTGWKVSRTHGRRAYIELGGGRVTEACQELADLAVARQVLHPADPLLDAHITGSKKHDSGDGWRFVRRGAGHCDAAYAAAGAVKAALSMPEPATPQIRMVG
jgi:hypothetical protein